MENIGKISENMGKCWELEEFPGKHTKDYGKSPLK